MIRRGNGNERNEVIDKRKQRTEEKNIPFVIDVDFTYPEYIPLVIDGKFAMELPVEYQWKPAKCETCSVFGHLNKHCPKKRKTRGTSKQVKVVPIQPVTTAGDASKDNGSIGLCSAGFREEDVIQDATSKVDKEATGGSGATITCSEGLTDLGSGDSVISSESAGINNAREQNVTTPQTANVAINHQVSKDKNVDGQVVAGVKNGNKDVDSINKAPNSAGVGNGNENQSENCNCFMQTTQASNSLELNAVNKILSSTGTDHIDSGGDWTVVKGKKTSPLEKGKPQQSPKKNPFMVYSDFTSESRFPINRTTMGSSD